MSSEDEYVHRWMYTSLYSAVQVALVVALVATNVAAQHLPWPYGTALVPASAVTPVVAVKEPSTVVVKSLVENPVQMKGLFGVPVSSVYQYPHVVQVAIPSQDTTRGMPQPVEDTPEVLFLSEFSIIVSFEVVTAATMKNAFFWEVRPCGSCKNWLYSVAETYCVSCEVRTGFLYPRRLHSS
jgi:hypothetical protein